MREQLALTKALRDKYLAFIVGLGCFIDSPKLKFNHIIVTLQIKNSYMTVHLYVTVVVICFTVVIKVL